jgi:hypothetical protein
MRDARILGIYEGTNGIQANDLVFRKLIRDQGLAFNNMMTEIDTFLRGWPKDMPDELNTTREALASAVIMMKESAHWILQNGRDNPAAAAASAAPFLRLCGNALGGHYLICSAVLAHYDLKAQKGDAEFLKAKIISARFFAAHVLPQCAALAATVRTGAAPTLDMLETMF